jgi:hypothetical protein
LARDISNASFDNSSKLGGEQYPEIVSFKDYLPNFIKNTPLKREYSSSYKTQKYYPPLKIGARTFNQSANTTSILGEGTTQNTDRGFADVSQQSPNAGNPAQSTVSMIDINHMEMERELFPKSQLG